MLTTYMFMLGIFVALFSSMFIAASAAESDRIIQQREIARNLRQQRVMDEELAKSIQQLIKCKFLQGPPNANLYCNLRFRGLEMDFAGINGPRGGALYVTALGKNQTLHSVGTHCIVIAFADRDLRYVDLIDSASILFMGNGKITYAANEKALRECY